MQTEFRVLAELCEKLEATSKRTMMVNLVANLLEQLNADEVEPTTSMILCLHVEAISRPKSSIQSPKLLAER